MPNVATTCASGPERRPTDAAGDGSRVCDDCDDGDADATTWYIDYDGDGYGSARYASVACAAPQVYVDNADECDDTEATVSPAGVEVCNGVDVAAPWIGFNDLASEGSWVWQNGDDASYTNWGSGEPNNSGDEDCAHPYDSGAWNDHRCSGLSTGYICETP